MKCFFYVLFFSLMKIYMYIKKLLNESKMVLENKTFKSTKNKLDYRIYILKKDILTKILVLNPIRHEIEIS